MNSAFVDAVNKIEEGCEGVEIILSLHFDSYDDGYDFTGLHGIEIQVNSGNAIYCYGHDLNYVKVGECRKIHQKMFKAMREVYPMATKREQTLR